MSRVTDRRRVRRVSSTGEPRDRTDVLAVEEPLEIRIHAGDGSGADEPVTVVTMRTPGADFDLVSGFLVGEGIVTRPEHVTSLRYCAGRDGEGRQTYNVVDALLAPDITLPDTARRQTLVTSACGICGATSIAHVRRISRLADHGHPVRVELATLLELPDRLRAAQQVFARTGGVHAAGLFTADGVLVCLREDVGRHNAVDKAVGWALREGRLPVRGHVLQVSGRASFELVQKAHLAGIPVLAAVGAPSSLAVELADDVGITLVGFSRGSSANVYCHPERVVG